MKLWDLLAQCDRTGVMGRTARPLAYALAFMALLVSGCGSLETPNHPAGLPVRYHNAQYGLTFFLPVSWQGYSVLVQKWEGQKYLAESDEVVVRERGPVIVLRHPRWRAGAPYQDIPIQVFTRSQWEAHHQGSFSIGAGGLQEEIQHNSKYVFAISSRFNADDTVRGWKEANDIVPRNSAVNEPHLHPI